MKVHFIPFLLIVSGLFVVQSTTAQSDDSSPFLFEEYMPGTAVLKSGMRSNSRFNIQTVTGELYFNDGSDNRILDPSIKVDTLYIGSRIFLSDKGGYTEMIALPNVANTQLLIEWRTKQTYVGRKGALGSVSHAGNVQEIDKHTGIVQGTKNNLEVYRYTPQNKYLLKTDESTLRFNDLKSFQKLFPKNQADAIAEYVKAHSIDFQQVEDVLRLLLRFTPR